MFSKFHCRAINRLGKIPLNVYTSLKFKSNQTVSASPFLHLTKSADAKIDGIEEILNSSQILSPLKLMQLYQKQKKHSDVLNVWNDLKSKHPAAIDNEILSLVVASAAAGGKSQSVIDLIDYSQTIGIKVTPQLGLFYIKACGVSKTAGGVQLGGWSRAVGMLDTITTAQISNKGMNHKGKGKSVVKPLRSPELKYMDVMSDCFQETLLLCASSGKWRNVLDIVEKAHDNKCPLTERMLSAAVICCAREGSGITEAHNMFRYMVNNDIPRSLKVYTAVLQGIVKTKQWNLYELVWENLLLDNLPKTDAVYASRIEIHSALKNIEEAELTLKEALLSIKRPKQSYNALYLALLKSGDGQKAFDLVTNMSENGLKQPEKHTASFHVQSLAMLGLVEKGFLFLREQEHDDDDTYVNQRGSRTESDAGSEGEKEDVCI